MKKTIGTIALLALGVALVLAPAPARAACGVDVSFGQVNGGQSQCGGAGYCYVLSPGLRTTSSIQGSFWTLTAGVPALGAGVDNGGWNVNSGVSWLPDLGFGGGVALNGGWGQNASIDGCVETVASPQKMVVALSDVDASNTSAFYAVACTTRNGGAATEFDFNNVGGNILLKALPNAAGTKQVNIVSTTRGAGPNFDTQITVGSPSLASIYYSDGSPGCAIANVIKQYDVWIKQVARNAPAPTNRDAAAGAWTLGNTCNVGTNCVVTTACGGTNCDNYVAVSPRLDSGFQMTRVSGNSTLVQAGPVLATPPPFKVIKKAGSGDKIK